MSRRPRCIVCGTGLSRKHRLSAAERDELQRAGESSQVCSTHGKTALERVRGGQA